LAGIERLAGNFDVVQAQYLRTEPQHRTTAPWHSTVAQHRGTAPWHSTVAQHRGTEGRSLRTTLTPLNARKEFSEDPQIHPAVKTCQQLLTVNRTEDAGEDNRKLLPG